MESDLLFARVKDLSNLCEKTSTPKFLGFLTPVQAAEVEKRLGKTVRYSFCGGYAQAERTILCFLPDWCEQPVYPITAFTFSYRACDTLTHRDFLGALMALGIARETIGDILVEAGRTVVFVHSDIARFVSSQISKIGNVGVTITEGFIGELPTCGKKQEFTTTIASTRIDCVVASICNISRSDAASRVEDGLVFVNSIACEKCTRTINAGDIITVRHKGRFEIASCDEVSKKGRIIFKYNKYV